MSTDIQVEPKGCVFLQKSEPWTTMNSSSSSSDEVPSNQAIINSASGRGNASAVDESAHTPDDADNDPTINDVESLKKGVIKTSKNEPYTILLVGETGVGKSSVLEFIANVLLGKDTDNYDFKILDHTNEQGGLDNQSQTNSARLYEFTSSNGVVVRILDTPGLADTRGIQQDELHKRSIATEIKKHIESVTAVLVLANGTVPRVAVGTEYALSTLSTIFPNALAHNIAFMFTNVLSPLHWNFSVDSVPRELQNTPQFLLNNPIALQKKYLKLKDDPNMKKTKAELRKAVKVGEENALEMLVELYDWLDGLEPQPTTGLFPLHEAPQNITNPPAPMGQVAAKKATISAKPAPSLDYHCTVPNCYSTCSTQISPVYVLIGKLFRFTQLARCSRCTHPYLFHIHVDRLQAQGDLNRVTGNDTDEPSPVVGEYARRWPSGSLSARVEKAIRLLEHGRTDMEKKGVSRERLESMQRSLGRMKRILDLLERLREGIRKVKKIFIRA